MIPRDAPSSAAAITQGQDFQESDYTSMAVVVLEAQGRQLGEQDHKYYDEMVRRLLDDKEHVQSLMNLWGDPVTRSGQQSADAQAATLTVRPTGDLGTPTRTGPSRPSAALSRSSTRTSPRDSRST